MARKTDKKEASSGRVNLKLMPELKARISEIARNEHRTINAQIELMLEQRLRELAA